MIPNAKSSDAGIYRVKISALNLGRPNCDARILPDLEYLAMSAPVTFVLTQGKSIKLKLDIKMNFILFSRSRL